MAKMDSLKLNYQSDLKVGGVNGQGLYNNYSFKMRAGYSDCYGDGRYLPNTTTCACSPGKLFKPRALIAKFSATVSGAALSRNCATIRFPVATPTNALIRLMVNDLKACGAVCIDLDGEEWSVVPPSLAGYTPTQKIFSLPVGVRSPKVSGSMPNYSSDGLAGNQVIGVRYEASPIDLTGAVLGDPPTPGGVFELCHGTLEQNAACAGGASIQPRRAIARAKGVDATVGSAVSGAPLSQLVRQMPIRLPADILECIKTLGNVQGVECVGYKGESIKRIDLLIA
jgi:hypothetical protein